MAHSCLWETGGVYRAFSATLSPDEVITSNFELHVDPRFGDIEYVINDFTGVDRTEILQEHTTIFARTEDVIAQTKHRLKIALVVRDELQQMLAQAFCDEMKSNPFDCAIFQSLDDARDWTRHAGR